MKLLPLLAATLLQESEAACAAGDSVITVNCREDLVVELTVNADCLDEKFEHVEITELQINPTDALGVVPANQCLPCTSPPCSESTNFMAYDFNDDSLTAAQKIAVSDSTTTLYFKAGQCGTSMRIDGANAIFETDIGKPAEKINGIVVEPTLLETDITCAYPATIDDIAMDPGMTVLADAVQESDKIAQDDNVAAVSDDLFSMASKIASDDSAIDNTSNVVLGTTVKIEVKSTDPAVGGDDFYLSDCMASNGLASTDSNYKTETLVTGGCMNDLGALDDDISASIADILAADGTTVLGTTLQFNQFAFADQSQEALTLLFKVTCDIVLGDAPTAQDCANRKDGLNGVQQVPDLSGAVGRRRRATDSSHVQTTEYKVTAGTKIAEVSDNGIVVAHSGSGKATDDDAESGAVSAAVAIMAGTAVMLL
jgi:hypothetical protein